MLTARGSAALLGLLLAVAFGAGGGDVRADDVVPYRHFTTFDGLPNDKITALAQTSNGLLWVGTETGLVVYDGHQFRPVALPDSFGTTYVSVIRSVPDGAVWVSPSKGQIVRVTHYGIDRVVGLGDEIVQQIVHRRDTLYVFTKTTVWKLGPEAETATRLDLQYDIRPSAVESDPGAGAGVFNADVGPNGSIWILDGRLGPGRLQPDGSVAFVDAPRAPPGAYWYKLRFAKDGAGLALQGERVVRFDPSKRRFQYEVVFDNLGTPSSLSLRGDTAYVTRNQTLLRYDVGTERTRSSLGPDQGLPEQTPTHALRGQEGGLWIGTDAGLIYVMAPDARQVQRVEDRPLQNVGQFMQRGQTLWARTYGSGLIQLLPRRRRLVPDGLVGWRQDVRSRHDALHVIASETRGWYRWEGGRDWHRVQGTGGAISGFVGPNGRGYFLHEDGLYRHSPGADSARAQLVVWPDDQLYRNNIAPGPDGDIVHRAGSAFLRRRRPDGAVQDTVGVLPELEHSNMRDMAVTPDRQVWCAFLYEKGLMRFDPDTDTREWLLEGEALWRVDVAGDSLVLASTRTNGLFLIDRTGNKRRHLTRAHGLRSDNVTAAHLTRDTLYVGHPNGLTRLPVDRLERSLTPPPTLLTELEINLETKPPTLDSLRAASERNLGFSFTGVSLADPGRIQYEYRLLPRDTTWGTSARGFTRYTNLDPGTYRFEVRARRGKGPPGPPATYAFTIPPHFYETVWFRALLVLGLLGLGGSGYHWRVRHLRRRQKKLEAAVQARTEELAEEKRKTEEQAERLAELDEAKNRFFAHISHEFRTPLSLLLGPIESALRETDDEIVSMPRDRLRSMRRSASRLKRLIDQLLDLATLEAGRMTLSSQPGDVAALVRRTAEAFRSKADRENISLEVDGPEGGLETYFDPDKVETIISNLVSNALRYTPEGGTVGVRVEASSQEEEKEVRIEVSDTGPGLDEDAQEEIFDRFTQVDTEASEDHGGVGLGLALSSELVELHDGTIAVESTPGEGSTFIIRLPLVPVPAGEDVEVQETGADVDGEARTEMTGTEDEPEEPRGEQIDEEAATILVVEDNTEMRTFLRDRLSTQWQVLEAEEGAEGWARVQEQHPDLVLSDVMMPELNGFELCRKIKDHPELRITPVLLLTARAGEEAALEGLECGADDYLAKPFEMAELRQRIENHLAARRHLQAHYQEEVHVEPAGMTVDAEDVPFLEKVLEAIEAQLSNPDLTVERLAGDVALSRRQLTRRLKDVTGETPAAFIRRQRIERAKSELEENPATIAEVAYAVGFRSPSHFSQVFREEVGCSPSTYVEQFKV